MSMPVEITIEGSAPLVTIVKTWDLPGKPMASNLSKYGTDGMYLVPDRNNVVDKQAVMVTTKGHPIGYLPKDYPHKPEIFGALLEGKSVTIRVTREVAALSMANKIKDEVPSMQLDLPLPKKERVLPPGRYYNITSYVLVKPNKFKAGSENWSPNWLGYFTPVGRYLVNGDIVHNFSGMQFAVLRNKEGLLVAQRRKRASLYNDTNHPMSDSTEFELAATTLLRNIRADEVISQQPKLVKSYSCDFYIKY